MKTHETKLGTAFNADCFEVMKLMPDGFVDMILADLPYGAIDCKWDNVIPFEKLWPEFNRICKPNAAMVFTGTEPFSTLLRSSNLRNYKYDWIWDKHIPRGMHIAKVRPMQKHENISVFTPNGETPKYCPIMTLRDKPVKVKNYGKSNSSPLAKNDGEFRTYTHKGPDSILVGYWEANRGKIHPTQKPVALFDYLIKTYTNEGDLVFDPTAGSLTTAVAAEALNRRWAVCELDEGYFDKGVLRL